MFRKAALGFAMLAVLTLSGGLADGAVADNGSGSTKVAVMNLIPPRCC